MKIRILSIICLTIIFASCAKNENESVIQNRGTSIAQTTETINHKNTIEEGCETLFNSPFPSEVIIAPVVEISSKYKYESGDKVLPGDYVKRFEFEDVKYTEGLNWGYFDFAIEDDGNIVIDGAEFEDNKVVQALNELYSLEYVGISYLNEHLFRFGDDLLAIAKNPAAKTQSVYFKDSDYDESQLYYAYIFEPND